MNKSGLPQLIYCTFISANGQTFKSPLTILKVLETKDCHFNKNDNNNHFT